MSFTAGQKVRTSDLANQPYGALVGGYVATGSALVLSAGSATTQTDLGVRAQTNPVSFTSGHTYVATLTINANCSHAGDAFVFFLRTVAAVGGAGSQIFGGSSSFSQLDVVTSGFDMEASSVLIWVATSTFTSNVYTSYFRSAGTGTINLYGNSGMNLTILDFNVTTMAQT